MVLTASFVLSPVIGLFCHRHLRCRKLDASVEASGPHDFAVRVSTVRQRCLRVHRIPCPTSVTIAIRPSCGMRRRNYKFDLGLWRSGIFFARGLDRFSRATVFLPVGQIRCAGSAEPFAESIDFRRLSSDGYRRRSTLCPAWAAPSIMVATCPRRTCRQARRATR